MCSVTKVLINYARYLVYLCVLKCFKKASFVLQILSKLCWSLRMKMYKTSEAIPFIGLTNAQESEGDLSKTPHAEVFKVKNKKNCERQRVLRKNSYISIWKKKMKTIKMCCTFFWVERWVCVWSDVSSKATLYNSINLASVLVNLLLCLREASASLYQPWFRDVTLS